MLDRRRITNVGSTIHLAIPLFALVAGASACHGATGSGDHAWTGPRAVAGHHRPDRSAGAAHRDHPAAAGRGGPRDVPGAPATGCGTARAGVGPRANTSNGRRRRRCGNRVIGCSGPTADTSGLTAAGQADRWHACTSAYLALPALAILVGCVRDGSPPPRTTQVIVQPQHSRPRWSSRDRLRRRKANWCRRRPSMPGRWSGSRAIGWLSGTSWVWQPGQYVPPPPGQTTWVPGRWMQQPSGGWTWLEGPLGLTGSVDEPGSFAAILAGSLSEEWTSHEAAVVPSDAVHRAAGGLPAEASVGVGRYPLVAVRSEARAPDVQRLHGRDGVRRRLRLRRGVLQRASLQRLRPDAVAQPDRLRSLAPHARYGDLRDGQFARAVQSADARGGRVRDDRRASPAAG